MMHLYVNGDSHTAAAEAVNNHAFAEDDPLLFHLGRLPHPDNLAISWGQTLANALKIDFHCDAESASSNDRILRTTQRWIRSHYSDLPETLIIIQWSTWEREEWLHDGVYYQVNASGIDHVPDELKDRYQNFIISIDWNQKIQEWHDKIWALHGYLDTIGVKHIFFNGNTDFSKIQDRRDWGRDYIGPYDPKMTFSEILRAQGHGTVATNSYHFGKSAHSAFSHFMLQYCIDNHFV